MTRRVVLLVPDAGPLISLATIDRLELLLAVDLPIYLVDQVAHEVTVRDTLPDARRIRRFIHEHTDMVTIFSTAVGQAAARRRSEGETGRQKGQGEAAIAEFLARMDEVLTSPDDPVLLLYEDSDIMKRRFVMPDNVHILSTRAFLLGLEQRGRIPSANALWQAINRQGRPSADTVTDRPGRTPTGRSAW